MGCVLIRSYAGNPECALDSLQSPVGTLGWGLGLSRQCQVWECKKHKIRRLLPSFLSLRTDPAGAFTGFVELAGHAHGRWLCYFAHVCLFDIAKALWYDKRCLWLLFLADRRALSAQA